MITDSEVYYEKYNEVKYIPNLPTPVEKNVEKLFFKNSNENIGDMLETHSVRVPVVQPKKFSN